MTTLASGSIMKSTETNEPSFGRKSDLIPNLLALRAQKPVRIPRPEILAHPVLRGSKPYLRALRAAEMAAWNARINLPLAALFVAGTGGLI